MAARKRRIRHDEDTRAKIQATQLIKRLSNHALGEVDMTTTQVQAARILLDRTLPVLSSVEVGGEDGGPLQVQVVRFADDSDTT